MDDKQAEEQIEINNSKKTPVAAIFDISEAIKVVIRSVAEKHNFTITEYAWALISYILFLMTTGYFKDFVFETNFSVVLGTLMALLASEIIIYNWKSIARYFKIIGGFEALMNNFTEINIYRQLSNNLFTPTQLVQIIKDADEKTILSQRIFNRIIEEQEVTTEVAKELIDRKIPVAILKKLLRKNPNILDIKLLKTIIKSNKDDKDIIRILLMTQIASPEIILEEKVFRTKNISAEELRNFQVNKNSMGLFAMILSFVPASMILGGFVLYYRTPSPAEYLFLLSTTYVAMIFFLLEVTKKILHRYFAYKIKEIESRG